MYTVASFDSAFWGPIAAFMASVTWATGVLAYSKLSHQYPAYIINFHRILIGFPAACLLLTVVGGWGPSFAAMDMTKALWAVVVVLSSYAFGDALFLMSTRHMGGPGALAIASIYPLWSAVWGSFFEGQSLSYLQIIGIVVVVAGVVAVILSGAKKDDLAPSVPRLQDLEPVPSKKFWREARFLGVLLAFGASLSWAMNAIAVAKLGQGLNAMFVNVLRLGIAVALCPLVGIMMNGRASFKLISKKDLVPALPVFGVECILGPFFFAYGLANSSLAVGAALSALAPAISVPVAVLMGRERFSKLKTAGVAAVVAGVWLLLGV